MPQRSVASNYTFEQQRTEINLLAADFWNQKATVDGDSSTYLKHDGSNAFTGQTLAVPNAFTINSNSGGGTVTIAGNLDVTGTTTTVSSANLEVTDKNILISKGSTTDAQADGAGITIDSGTDITWNFVNAKDAWVSSIGVEGTTFVKGPYGQFTGSGTPTTGQGVEVNAPDANTGQIISYDRTNTAYKELRLKGSSVGVYTGTTNALRASFNSSGLEVEAGDLRIPNDTGKVTCGQNADLQLYHDGGSSVIQNINNNASLYLKASSTGTDNIKCNANGGTQIFWNGVIGLYTAEDANNAGVPTVRIHDDVKLKMGNSSDFSIFHHGTEQANYIESTNNVLYICGKTGQTAVQITPDGATDLRHSGLKKLETTTSGIDIIGQLTSTNAATTEFIQLTSTNDSTRGIISVAGKDSSSNAVTVKIGGFGDTNRGEIFTHSDHNLGFATNNNSAQMVLDTDGRLLIGTTSSTSNAKLAVNGGIDNNEAFFELNRLNDPANDQNIGIIDFSQGNAASRNAARLVTRRDGGVWGAASLPSRFEFWTCPSGSNSPVERLRINSVGTAILNHNNDHPNSTLVLSKTDAGYAKLEYDVGTSQKAYIELDGSENLVHYGAAGVDQQFYTGGTSRLIITDDGNMKLGLDSVTTRTDSAHYGFNITGKSGTSGAGSIFFNDAADNCDGNIACDNGVMLITADYSDNTASSEIKFRVDGSSEKMNISSSGKVSCVGHVDTATYGASNWALTGSGNQSNTSQAVPEGSFQWQSNTSRGTEKYKSYIQTTDANEQDMYITVSNASFYRITIKASHNSTQADVAMYLVYGLNSSAGATNRITEVASTGGFTCTNHNTHVNSHDSTIKINYNTSLNQGMKALVELIGGF